MKEVVQKIYIAFDGTKFETAQGCIDYENTFLEDVDRVCRKIQQMCDSTSCDECLIRQRYNSQCPLSVETTNDNGAVIEPYEWCFDYVESD